MRPVFLRYALSQGPHGLADAVLDRPLQKNDPLHIVRSVWPDLLTLVKKSDLHSAGGRALRGGLQKFSQGDWTPETLRRITGGLSQLPPALFSSKFDFNWRTRSGEDYERFAFRRAARSEALDYSENKNHPAFWQTGKSLPEGQAQLLTGIEHLVERTPDAVVILDLDETLFASTMREWQIWQEFAKSNECQDPALREHLLKLKPAQITSWNLKEVMVDNLGVDAALFEAHRQAMRAFHAQRFFTNKYLQYDTPLPGAALFVGGLHARGAHIVYLTGRSEERMRDGTIGALLAGGFPIDPINWRVTLLMKPDAANTLDVPGESEEARSARQRASDEAYKSAAREQIAALGGTVVASLDDQPANVNALYNRFHVGSGYAVRMSTMATSQTLVDGVYLLNGFVR